MIRTGSACHTPALPFQLYHEMTFYFDPPTRRHPLLSLCPWSGSHTPQPGLWAPAGVGWASPAAREAGIGLVLALLPGLVASLLPGGRAGLHWNAGRGGDLPGWEGRPAHRSAPHTSRLCAEPRGLLVAVHPCTRAMSCPFIPSGQCTRTIYRAPLEVRQKKRRLPWLWGNRKHAARAAGHHGGTHPAPPRH